jgi:hypothetical protein
MKWAVKYVRSSDVDVGGGGAYSKRMRPSGLAMSLKMWALESLGVFLVMLMEGEG